MRLSPVFAAAGALLIVACTPAGSPDTSTAESSTTSTSAAATTTRPPPIANRIGIQTVAGLAEFYDTVTGERFVPRGTNYNMIELVDDPALGKLPLDVTLSNEHYDVARTEADLSMMENLGYNIVRIMPETCAATGCITGLTGGIRGEYIDNVVDFLNRAAAHGIYVWIASNTLPDVGSYINQAHSRDDAWFQSSNSEYLTEIGVVAYQRYFSDFVSALIDRGAPLEVIFSYSLRQEHSFDSASPPLSLESGTVTAANGSTYDLSDPAAKLQLVDEGLLHWIAEVGATIKALDPDSLISVGFFAPDEPNQFRGPDDPRLVRAVAALDSEADFLDFHVYPSPPIADLAAHVENYQMLGRDEKPIVMGEVAAFDWYPTVAAGAQALHDVQVESCAAGFDGWLIWTWDAPLQPEIWHAMSGSAEVAEALAPSLRPDPCLPGEFAFFEYELARDRPSRASRSLPDQPSSAAFDGGPSQWGAGADAPQWIEVELQTPNRVDAIRLVVAQYPAGQTTHEVWIRKAGGSLERLHVFSGSTQEPDVLEWIPDDPLVDVEVVRLVTTESPSWVAWREVHVVSAVKPAS